LEYGFIAGWARQKKNRNQNLSEMNKTYDKKIRLILRTIGWIILFTIIFVLWLIKK